MIVSAIYNSQRTSNKQKILTPADFMPDFDKRDDNPTHVNNDLQMKANLFRLLMS